MRWRVSYQSGETEDYEITPAGQWANEILQVLSYYVSGYEATPLHWDETVVGQKAFARSIEL